MDDLIREKSGLHLELPSDEKGSTSSLLRAIRVTEEGDANASTVTPYSIGVGDRFTGSISSVDPRDWVAIELVQGQDYVFTLGGRGGEPAQLTDPILRLMNSGGNQITFNDDINRGTVLYSAIEYTAAYTGTHYLSVEGFGGNTGLYDLRAMTDVFTITQVAAFLTDYEWGLGTKLHFASGKNGFITFNIDGLDADGKRLALYAFEAWTAATGLEFRQTSNPNAQIRFDDNEPGAFAGPGVFNQRTGAMDYARVNVNPSTYDADLKVIDSYGMHVFMHEIGHALGLGHAGSYDGVATYSDNALYKNDSWQMTVMSYFPADENTYVNGTYAIPMTPMAADIAAIRQIYGAPDSINPGDTIWGENSNIGGYLADLFSVYFEGAAPSSEVAGGIGIAFTIVDTGGVDTIDLRSDTTDQHISLRPGSTSDTHGLIGNLVIDAQTEIENVRAGKGDDIVLGNAGDNALWGGDGNDNLQGGQGNDRLIGGAGSDNLVGGDGFDVAAYGNARSAVRVDAKMTEFNVGDAAGDKFFSVEGIIGSSFFDNLRGTDNADSFWGRAGNDWLYGRIGDDKLFGGADHDVLVGGIGRDLLDGGAGYDRADYLDGKPGLLVDLAFQAINTGIAEGDRFVSIENLAGSKYADNLRGDDGRNEIRGREGNDYIAARAGKDRLDGGEGNDTLIGGLGADVFIFKEGRDTIRDFDQAEGDSLEIAAALLGGGALAGFGEVIGGDAVFDFGGGDVLIVENQSTVDLDYLIIV